MDQYRPSYKPIPPWGKHYLTEWYDFTTTVLGFGHKFKKRVIRHLRLQPNETVLDIGCGPGMLLKILKQQNPGTKVIGIDPDQKSLELAQVKLKDQRDVKLFHSFAESLPLEDNSVDVAVSTLAFHHMPNEIKLKAIQEIKRVLKPNGRALIVDFGPTKNIYIRAVLSYENQEYLKGNFDNLIPKYLQESGFVDIKTIDNSFPAVYFTSAKSQLA